MNNFLRLLNEYIQAEAARLDRPITHQEEMECAKRAKEENIKQYFIKHPEESHDN